MTACEGTERDEPEAGGGGGLVRSIDSSSRSMYTCRISVCSFIRGRDAFYLLFLSSCRYNHPSTYFGLRSTFLYRCKPPDSVASMTKEVLYFVISPPFFSTASTYC